MQEQDWGLTARASGLNHLLVEPSVFELIKTAWPSTHFCKMVDHRRVPVIFDLWCVDGVQPSPQSLAGKWWFRFKPARNLTPHKYVQYGTFQPARDPLGIRKVGGLCHINSVISTGIRLASLNTKRAYRTLADMGREQQTKVGRDNGKQ